MLIAKTSAAGRMTILGVVFAVALLIALIAILRVQPFVAFIVTSLIAALVLGLPIEKIPKTIERGIGDMLGSLSIVICLGAMFGKLIADSGAAQRISEALMHLFGRRACRWRWRSPASSSAFRCFTTSASC